VARLPGTRRTRHTVITLVRIAGCAAVVSLCLFQVSSLEGQQQPVLPPGFGQAVRPKPSEAKEAKAPPAEAAKPAPPAATQAPGEGQTSEQAAPPAERERPPSRMGPAFTFHNASLTEVIDILARQLKINYILDPRIKGGVTINTYGEMKDVDLRALLETILRVNGAAMVQVGNIYRIVPIKDTTRLPISPTTDPAALPADERMVLYLIFLKYLPVADVSKLLEPFLGEGATLVSYDPANLLLLLDNSRNMRRTMELVDLLDSEVLVNQRARLFELKYALPSSLAAELEKIMSQISLNEKASAVRFLPLDRINTILVFAPNPGVFPDIEKWIQKLDVTVQVSAGAVNNYVYRVKYGWAEQLAMSIMQLYGGGGYGYGFGFGFGGSRFGMMGGRRGGLSSLRGGGMGAYGGTGGMGTFGAYGVMGGYGSPYGGYGMMPWAGAGSFPGQYPGPVVPPTTTAPAGATVQGTTPTTAPTTTQDLTGRYLGAAAFAEYRATPRVVPNVTDNSLLIQATPQEYEQILGLLRQLDIPPRQVLIEAKIYEVTLTGAFAGGVRAALTRTGETPPVGLPTPQQPTGTFIMGSAGIALSAGMLVGESRQLLALLTLQEDNRQTRLISAPTIVATDSIPATINVGQDVPILTSQAVSSVQEAGSSLFTNTVSQRASGVTLDIVAMVSPAGVVTMEISQEVSAPQAPAADAAIQSPSFTTRNVSTQVTVQDGDTVAIGGIIQETELDSSSGVPYLHRIPGIGILFGSKAKSKARTELVVFLTPRVIYDTNQIADATEEVKSKLKRIQRAMKE